MSTRREKNKPQNTLNSQLVQLEKREKEKNDNLIQLGKFFYSLAALTYGGAVLDFILNFSEKDFTEYAVTLFIFFTEIMIAWGLIKIGNIKK